MGNEYKVNHNSDITNKKDKLNSIQCCRALAFLMVLMLHKPPSWDLLYIFQYGRYGVMVFFIISGFIITYLHVNGAIEDFKVFILKRIFRIYPVYFLSFLVSVLIVLGIYLSGHDGWQPFPQINNIGWMVSSTLLPLADKYLINLVAWSLVFEVWYYILFGLVMTILKDKFILGICAYAYIVLLAQCVFPEVVDNRNYLIDFAILLSPLNWLFIMGSCIAYLIFDTKKYYKVIVAVTFLVCYLCQVVIGYAVTLEEISSMFSEFILLSASLLLITGFIWLERENKLKVPAFLVRLGNMSYTLYLFHYIWLFVFGAICMPLLSRFISHEGLDLIAYYISLYVICNFIYMRFEIPSNQFLRSHFLSRKHKNVKSLQREL